MRSKGFWVLALIMGIPAGRAAAELPADAKDLAGTWVVSTVSREGKSSEDDKIVVAKITFVVDPAKETITVTPSKAFGGFGFRNTRPVTLDPAAKPHKGFDVPDMEGAGGEGLVGIYELQGGVLKLAFNRKEMGMAKRPGQFDTSNKTEHVSYTLAREPGTAMRTALLAAAGKRTMHGEWVAEEARLGGKKIPDEALKNFQFTITSDAEIKYKVGAGEKIDKFEGGDKADITVSDVRSPMRIDFENVNKRELGIIELQQSPKDTTGRDDVLIVCVDRSAIKRPTKFESPDGSDFMLVRFKRATKPQ